MLSTQLNNLTACLVELLKELRRIKNVDSNDINYISQQTGLTPKRVRKLLAVSPRGIRRALYQSNSREWERRTDFTSHPNFPIYSTESEDEERPSKPCMADLISLININLKGDQKTIFLLWAGINAKKIGPKEIARSLGKTEKYVYDNIYSAKRILSKAAKRGYLDMPKFYVHDGLEKTIIIADHPLQSCFKAIKHRFEGIPVNGYYKISEKGFENHDDDAVFTSEEVIPSPFGNDAGGKKEEKET